MNKKLEELRKEFLDECAEIEDYCIENGYPSNGTNYELMVDELMHEAKYSELFCFD